MMDVHRSSLSETLLLHLPLERVKEIMMILEPLYFMCGHNCFAYRNGLCPSAEIQEAIQFLTKQPCVGIEFIAESVIPQRFLISSQNSNFIARTRTHLHQKLHATLGSIKIKNLGYDLRISFGDRMMHVLPQNLWNQLWETVCYWLQCEIAGMAFEREAKALEQIVRLCASGYIVFDMNPRDPSIAVIVNTVQSTTNQRYRSR